MKSLLQLLIILVFTVGSVIITQAQSNSASGNLSYDFSKLNGLPTFRSIPWGSSKSDILSNETGERLRTGKQYLIVKDSLAGVEVEVKYFFWRGHFIKGVYETFQNLGEYSNYFDRYARIKEVLTEKYGTPILDITNWKNMRYKNNPGRWLVAVRQGDLEHVAYWKLNYIIISARFASFNGTPEIQVEYLIDNFHSDLVEIKNSEILEDL